MNPQGWNQNQNWLQWELNQWNTVMGIHKGESKAFLMQKQRPLGGFTV
jgi:hypothetical protein